MHDSPSFIPAPAPASAPAPAPAPPARLTVVSRCLLVLGVFLVAASLLAASAVAVRLSGAGSSAVSSGDAVVSRPVSLPQPATLTVTVATGDGRPTGRILDASGADVGAVGTRDASGAVLTLTADALDAGSYVVEYVAHASRPARVSLVYAPLADGSPLLRDGGLDAAAHTVSFRVACGDGSERTPVPVRLVAWPASDVSASFTLLRDDVTVACNVRDTVEFDPVVLRPGLWRLAVVMDGDGDGADGGRALTLGDYVRTEG